MLATSRVEPQGVGVTRLALSWQRLTTVLTHSTPADSVAVFRIGFGVVVMVGCLRFLARGWVDSLYLAPQNHLSYPYFDWIAPLPAPLMHLHMLVLAGLGACIALGYRQRLAAILFTVSFVYVELIEAALYLNHYWFVTLVAILLVLLPVANHWSIDAHTARLVRSPTVSRAVVWVLRAQVGVVYVFAGVAKLNGDWLLRAQPLKIWLADRTHLPFVGGFLDEPLLAYVASWSAALFDCTIVGWLLWRRSRPWAFAVLVCFHLTTAALFQIGLFPWLMLVAATIFFEPDWPSRLAGSLRRSLSINHTSLCRSSSSNSMVSPTKVSRISKGSVVALLILAGVQLVLPLRHYAYASNVRWSEEGYYWAWRVMITEKAGHVDFYVTDPVSQRVWIVDPTLVLTDWQAEHAATRPDLIHATALMIADHYKSIDGADVEVRADAWVSMNGRSARRMINPTVDLAAESRSLAPAHWILP